MTEETQAEGLKPITLEDARGLLARAVLTQGPDFIYTTTPGEGCYNVPIGQLDKIAYPRAAAKYAGKPQEKTGCLVGTALSLHGFTFTHNQGYGVSGLPSAWFDAEECVYVQSYLNVAQDAQDEGNTWGEAYLRAEARLT